MNYSVLIIIFSVVNINKDSQYISKEELTFQEKFFFLRYKLQALIGFKLFRMYFIVAA